MQLYNLQFFNNMFGFKSYLHIKGGLNKGINNKIPFQALFGKEGYELLHYDYNFYQNMDDKGKANSEVRGGQFRLLIDTLPTDELIEWGMKSYKYHDGEIGICPTDQNSSMVKTIRFERAYCTDFQLSFVEDGTSFVKTMLMLTAEVIYVGDERVWNEKWNY